VPGVRGKWLSCHARMSDDTIVAIATPPGSGGIGVVRLSGTVALEVALRLIRLPKFPPQIQHATRGDFIDPSSGSILDQVVLIHFAQPRSYTGEDVVEISCHGAPVILRYLVECCTASGARLAEPGEFTMRAFLNGRIDLTQAEAIRDLIDSRTLYQARVAARQAGGAISARLKPSKEDLVELIARLEAGIDFAEDDVPVSDWEEIVFRINAVRCGLAHMAEGYEFGRIIREGLSLAVVGRPNVGKSSLFNRLLNQDRAIVTAMPGTTRDLVSETASICGIPVRLVDTAGIRETLDQVERIGVERSLQAIADSDLRLLVVDAAEGWTDEDERLFQRMHALGRLLVAVNKCDLARREEFSFLAKTRPVEEISTAISASPVFSCDSEPPGQSPPYESTDNGRVCDTAPDRHSERRFNCEVAAVRTSALTGEGLPELQELILSLSAPARELSPEGEVVTNLRHQDCVRQALASLAKAREAALCHIPHEMMLLDLYEALHALDAVTGATTTDDLLGVIFSTFCVGK
jgi:tRNA modification GTPase